MAASPNQLHIHPHTTYTREKSRFSLDEHMIHRTRSVRASGLASPVALSPRQSMRSPYASEKFMSAMATPETMYSRRHSMDPVPAGKGMMEMTALPNFLFKHGHVRHHTPPSLSIITDFAAQNGPMHRANARQGLPYHHRVLSGASAMSAGSMKSAGGVQSASSVRNSADGTRQQRPMLFRRTQSMPNIHVSYQLPSSPTLSTASEYMQRSSSYASFFFYYAEDYYEMDSTLALSPPPPTPPTQHGFDDADHGLPSATSAQRAGHGISQADAATLPPLIDDDHPRFPPITLQNLQILRHHAIAHPNDYPLQLYFAKFLMEAVKQVDMTDAKRTVKAKTGMLTEAQRIVKKLAMPGLGKPGYPAAMFLLANAYGAGLMLLRANHEKAFHLYVQGSKQHHPACTYRAGVCYELGIGTRKNNAQASQFYRKAANLGDPAAMYKLAMMLLHGLSGHGKHPKEAISWLKRAVPKADPNYPEILHELAIAYENEGIPSVIPDVDYSRELFTKAALIGYAPSQYRLGLAFENGMLNCPVDARLSIAWYSKSAAQGHFDAALALSGWYLTGAPMIMPQDDREAYLWARKTAELGYPKGQFACGYYCETGIGVEQSLDQAIFWYKQAANQQYARAIQRLEELKSPKATRKKQNRLRHHHQDQSVATTTTIIESPVLPSPTLTSKHARRLSNLLSLNTNTSPTLPILSPSPMTAQKPTNEDNCIIM